MNETSSESSTESDFRNPGRARRWAWQAVLVIVPLLTGLDIIMSTAGNAAFSKTVQSIFWAVASTYLMASIFCSCWAIFSAQDKFGVVLKRVFVWIKDRPLLSNKWLMLCGGLCGASQNIIGALVTKKLGSAIFSLSMLAGTVITSSIIDHYGLVWTIQRDITWMSISGILIVVCGCVLYRLGGWISGHEDLDEEEDITVISAGMQVLYVALAIFCGFTSAFQGPLGAQLGRVTGQFRWAAAWSFTSGLVPTIILAFAISGLPVWNGMDLSSEWFSFLPGVLVIISLFVTAWFPRHLPVSTVWCLVISGQILSSAVLDSQGWVGLDQRSLDWFSIGGIILVLIGITVIAVMKQPTKSNDSSLVAKSGTPRVQEDTIKECEV